MINLAAKAIINSFNTSTINSEELKEIELSSIFSESVENWVKLNKGEKD